MIKSTLAAVALAAFSTQALANWQLANEQSMVSFVSLKKADVMEAHHFKQLKGSLNDSGHFNLAIDLSSVDTAISIRDQRMAKHLFEVVKFPKAMLSAIIAPKTLENIAVNQTVSLTVPASLALHGETKKLSVKVDITRLSNNDLLVVSSKPVLVKAGDFNLVQGIEKLRQLAGLPSISNTVPVSFTLRLNK